ncbi:MAG: hypothetical protein RR540_06590 [Oscillospiraceae bacterium]
MNFTFETVPIEGKETLRQGILDRFGRDISTASCTFSSRNYVFIFGEGCFPAIIRVGTETPERGVQDVLSELMWMDDLKNDIPNICQPLPSIENRMVERIAVGEKVYLLTMFRKANGAIFPDTQWTADYFYNQVLCSEKFTAPQARGFSVAFAISAGIGTKTLPSIFLALKGISHQKHNRTQRLSCKESTVFLVTLAGIV